MKNSSATLIILCLSALCPRAVAQHDSMPPGMSHEDHLKQMSREAGMKNRGDSAMGFDQDRVIHHFVLTRTGGIIDVRVKQSPDEGTRGQIRDHLRTLRQEFADGIFTSPIATHGEVPPGVLTLRERKASVTYSYEETPEGARVKISTADRTARTSVYDFLRYQIREHATGDPMSVQK